MKAIICITIATIIFAGLAQGKTGTKAQGEWQQPKACILASDTGPCRGFFPRFFFNSANGKCESFIYGGCNGNANNFEIEADCWDVCSAKGNGAGGNLVV